MRCLRRQSREAILSHVFDYSVGYHGQTNYKILYGGDLNENADFNEGKLVMHGYKIVHSIWGDLNEHENLKEEKVIMLSFVIKGLT